MNSTTVCTNGTQTPGGRPATAVCSRCGFRHWFVTRNERPGATLIKATHLKITHNKFTLMGQNLVIR